MSSRRRHAARVTELVDQSIPFVHATVVRAQCPTSARPGDSAIVLADGSIEGFIGGSCAEGSVRVAAADLLDTGETLLLRILPEGEADFPVGDGARTVVNPCLSGGAIEVFLEPKLPAARIAIVGSTPIAEALEVLAENLGFGVASGERLSPDTQGLTAVLVSSHGRHEAESIRAALDAGVEFVGLVASGKRGSSVLDEMMLTAEERSLVRTPVGVDIGATTAEEIALSILAEVVQAVRLQGLRPPATAIDELPETALDPVCGMTVVVAADTPHLLVDGVDYWFCNPGCRARYAEEAGNRG